VSRTGWLFVAGLCAGLPILVKVVGLYFVAAGLLFLLYREQERTAEFREPGPATGFRVATATGLLLFARLVVALVARTPDPMTLFHFAVPPLAVAATCEEDGTLMAPSMATLEVFRPVAVGQ